jgi:hypothetical protein
MASSTGGIIEAADYNDIRNKVIRVLGTGDGNFGYGQAARLNSAAVATGASVTAAQWQNLRWDIFNALTHQNGSAPTIVSVSTGDTIRYGDTNPNNAYNTFANTITDNRFNIGSGRSDAPGLGSKSENFSWISQAYIDITYTFSNADAARFFFNSGGELRITSTFVKGPNTQQNRAWESLLRDAAVQSFGGNAPDAGLGTINGRNFYRLDSTFRTYYTRTDSFPYGSNTYRLQAKCNLTSGNNSTGTANIVTIRALFTDGYTDPGNSPGDNPNTIDQVSGIMTVSTSLLLPVGTMQTPPTVSNFTIVGPTSNIASAVFIRT